MRIRILGKYWTFRFVPNLGKNHGTCGHPESPEKQIRVEQGLRGEALLEVVIHEVLHAANWHLDEEFVTEFASDVARILRHKQIWKRITDGEGKD